MSTVDSPVAPSTAEVPLAAKLGYALGLLRNHADSVRDHWEIQDVWNDVAEYERLISRHCGARWHEARVVEIGYGARPWRLLALRGLGIDVTGIDMERPAILGGLGELREILATNGIERTLKSAVRGLLFDRADRRAFARTLSERGLPLRIEPERMLVGDAADLDVASGGVDVVYSEDVFEHMTPESLRQVAPKIASWLRPDGIALIRPNVFTGITGGHALDWNRRSFRAAHPRRRRPPWEHLTSDGFTTNTHLNRWTREDYRALFSEHFVIEEERVKLPDLGREFLTPALRARLEGFDDDELFSNQVLFVLRRRPAVADRT